jgi:hypothetical protein
LGKGSKDWTRDENAFVLSAQEINIYVINAFVNKWTALQLGM